MTTSFNQGQVHIELGAGTIIHGVWNKSKYRVERLLGRGANGVVYYVVRMNSRTAPAKGTALQGFALKIGAEAVDFQSEINALTSLESARHHTKLKGERQSARPFLVEVDDVEIGGKRHPFYVMRYVEGVTLSTYLRRHGNQWFGLIGSKLLYRLAELHAAGWIFSDLKAENVLVSPDGEVELVDYGGLTRDGGSIRQFTELYDRGYWNGGLRSADIGYDLFSFAVLAVHLYQKDALKRSVQGSLPQTRQREDLMEIIRDCPALRPYQQWLQHAIYGRFHSTEEAWKEWKQISGSVYRRTGLPNHPTPRWLKLSFTGSVMLIVVILIYYAR